MEVYGIVYLIWNLINGKRYVGQTTQTLEVRMKGHFYGDQYVDRAIRKYGRENFRYGVIKTCATREELNACEMYYIAVLKTKSPYGYNLTDGGEGATGFKFTPEQIAANSGENHHLFGKHLPPEYCSKISVANRGDSPYKNLLAEMDARHLSYSALARLLGYSSHKNLSQKILDRVSFTDKDEEKLVAFFGKPIEYLLARDDGKPRKKPRRKPPEKSCKKPRKKPGRKPREKPPKKPAPKRRGDSPYKNLLAEIDARNMSYTALAELLGTSRTTVSRKMLGKDSFTGKDEPKLVEIFSKPVEYLLARDDGKTHEKWSSLKRSHSPYKNLLTEMNAHNLSCIALGEMLGLTRSTTSRKLLNQAPFTDSDKAKLVEFFGKPIEYLLHRDD